MTAQEFIFNAPLYQKIVIKEEDFLRQIKGSGDYIFEGYNPTRQKESSFCLKRGLCNYSDDGDWSAHLIYETGARKLLLECKRYTDRLSIYVYWDAEEKSIMKIGQYPSVADIHIGQIKKYDKVLSKEKLKEFARAIGLAANGVGVGSFVYLRRIFESLIFEIAEKSIREGVVAKSDFEKSRMDEKIEQLKNHLPQFLVDNKSIYKILSVGIHGLSENDCLAYFDVMRVSIELILDERLEELEKETKAKKAKEALSLIVSSIKKQNDKQQD